MYGFSMNHEIIDNKLVISLHGDLDAYYTQNFKKNFMTLIDENDNSFDMIVLNF